MSTDDVLDAIDHALSDWTVSGDAMRWAPEPEAVAPRELHVSGGIVLHTAPVGTDPRATTWRRAAGVNSYHFISHEGALRRAIEILGEARPIIEWAEVAAERMGMAVDQFARHISAALPLTPLVDPTDNDEPEDPKARALRLRRERNTGPDRQMQNQRRPRRTT